jgi:hypothetical protein
VIITTYFYSAGFRYNYDFILKQHYLELGTRNHIIKNFWGLARGAILIFFEKSSQRPGTAPRPDEEKSVWDIELKLGYDFNDRISIYG